MVKIKLGDVIDFKNGKSIKKSDGNIPIYGGNGILGYTDKSNFSHTIVVGRVGAYCGSIHVEENLCWVSDNAIAGIPKEGQDLTYLYYVLRSLNLNSKQIGSSQPLITQSMLKDMVVDIEIDIEKQKRIANSISIIDQKIQINNQINQELEAIAKFLYDYWFVQFNFPDQNGKPYKSSGGKMVYNPELKREIPEGWGVEKLGDVAYLKAGGDKPSNISEIQSKETPFPIYSNGLDNKGLYGYTNKAAIHKKSLTVSARGTIGYVQRRFSSFFPIIRLISVTPKEEKMIGYIENFLKSIQFENSGSVQRQLTVPQIDKLYILVPKNEVLKKYHSMTVNYYSEVENNEQQNQELIQLRDWLLPMLMNGQVKVE